MADAEIEPKPANENALIAEIDRTRAELARTIDAISERVNPKRNVDRAMEQVRQRADQARQRADQARQRASQRASQIDPVIAGAAIAALALGLGVTALFLVRRRRR